MGKFTSFVGKLTKKANKNIKKVVVEKKEEIKKKPKSKKKK